VVRSVDAQWPLVAVSFCASRARLRISESVTGGFGIVTDDFGNVTGHFGDVTERSIPVS